MHKNNSNQPDVAQIRQRLEHADVSWFARMEEVGDYASLAVARNLASTCKLEVGAGQGHVIAAPLFIPVTIMSNQPFEPEFDVSGLAGLVAGLHDEGVETALFPEVKSASQILAMNAVEAWSYTQEIATSSMDGNAMYGYLAFDPFGDVRKIGEVYLHTAVVTGWVRVVGEHTAQQTKLAQLDYAAKCSVSNLIASDIAVRTGQQPHCVMVGDVGAYAVIDQLLSEVNSYAVMQAVAFQGMKCEIEPALVDEPSPWRFYRLKDHEGELITTVEVPAERQGAFARQVQYLASIYGVEMKTSLPSRSRHCH
ncbi:hypothetical protein [Gulbenkiania mobilis]|uniref:hypothetical protein n=1 Tax=Gulbenkiania mobilis TaxID=397457 RepID=UPI0006BBD131|nr:hypothetical protein [Gulbenkiania mobilis]